MPTSSSITPFRIGVISDTHGHLDAKVARLFQGVSHIFHAGDIGYASIILELQGIAPTTAVSGNTDSGLIYQETETVDLGSTRFLIHHIVDVNRLEPRLAARIAKDRPRVVIFGHTHRAYSEEHKGVLFLNPGYSGTPKSNQSRSVAILHCDGGAFTTEFLEL